MASLTATSTLDEILHAIIAAGIEAAAIFVKNPNSQQHAASIINLITQTVLPLTDSLLNPQTALTVKAAGA